MPSVRSGHQILRNIAQYSQQQQFLCSKSSSVQIPIRQISCSWCSRGRKKKSPDCERIDVSKLPSDKYGNRCSYYFAMHEPKRSWLSRLLRKQRLAPLPTNYCPEKEPCKKEQVYWFGFERDHIDELCKPQKPPLHTCRNQLLLIALECGCLPPAQVCDPTRFHYPGMCVIRETYSTEPLVYRRCEIKPKQGPKPSLPPAVKCIKLACSFQRWLPVSKECSKTVSELLQVSADPYDEFNYAQRQQRSQQNAQLQLNNYCSGNMS